MVAQGYRNVKLLRYKDLSQITLDLQYREFGKSSRYRTQWDFDPMHLQCLDPHGDSRIASISDGRHCLNSLDSHVPMCGLR